MSPYIRKLSRETGKSEKEIEKLWNKAKEITAEEFGKNEKDFGSKEYAYTNGVIEKMLGLDEEVVDPSKFLNSDLTAKQFLETLVSSSFSIGNVDPPEDDEYDEEEEEEEDDEYKIETAEEEKTYFESVELDEEEKRLLEDLKKAQED